MDTTDITDNEVIMDATTDEDTTDDDHEDEGLVEDLHSSNSIKMKQLTTCTRHRDIQRMEILYV